MDDSGLWFVSISRPRTLDDSVTSCSTCTFASQFARLVRLHLALPHLARPGSPQCRDPGLWTTCHILLCHILLDSATSCATPDSGRLDLLVPTSTFASCLMRIVFPAFVVLPLGLYSWSCHIVFFYLPVASRLLPHATSCRFMRHVDIHCSTLFLLPWAWVRPVAVSPGNINSLLGDRIGLLIFFGGRDRTSNSEHWCWCERCAETARSPRRSASSSATPTCGAAEPDLH